MRFLVLFLPVIIVALCASTLPAATIHVPADETTIQAGIDAAADGDTVMVADGIYTGDGNRDINFYGKAIVVTSENGPLSCIVDAQGSPYDRHRGFRFLSGEDENSILQGFTIRGGYHNSGGAIFCQYSSPTIQDNIFTMNTVDSLTIEPYGGAIHCKTDAQALIQNNFFTRNTASYGAGIFCNHSNAKIMGNVIVGNRARVDAGAVDFIYSSPQISDNLMMMNTAGRWGGAMAYGYGAQPVIEDNIIVGNYASLAGGGLAFGTNSASLIRGNLIAHNATDSLGGGIATDASASPILENNTITKNIAHRGGGCYLNDNSTASIINSVFWDNQAEEGKEFYLDSDSAPCSLAVSYSDIDGGEGSVYVGPDCVLDWGDGMIDAEPMFVMPDKQDCRLLWGSPCIDMGCPDMLDADGTVCDMGAMYFNQDDMLTIYLTPDALWVSPGEELGVTFTAINRWDDAVPFWALSQVILSGGAWLNVLGPVQLTLQPHTTAQVHMSHPVPLATPVGIYDYWSRIGMPPSTLYDEDRFSFWVLN